MSRIFAKYSGIVGPILVGLFLLVGFSGVAQELIDPSKLQLINFDKIPPNQFSYDQNQLTIKVNKSSSALVYPFAQPRETIAVKVSWRSNYQSANDAKLEQTKKGDDFPLRVGLMIKSKAPWVPMFASSWIKKIRDIMLHETGKMIYVVMGSLQPEGSRWLSPYSDSIENVVANSKTLADGWFESSCNLASSPLPIVGYWIMSDGDDQGSSFETTIRELVLSSSPIAK